MHARAATSFVQISNRFQCDITVHKGNLAVNGKSIMGVLQLAASQGQTIEIEAKGEDGLAALEALAELIGNRFGEEE
jgi:phosphocarrier protein